MIDNDLYEIARRMHRKARRGKFFYGQDDIELLAQYTDFWVTGEYTVVMIFSRDVGHHSGGWLKNPDFERCEHLSLSFRGSDGHPMNPARRLERAPQMHNLARRIVQAFFGDEKTKVWAEPPFSRTGKKYQVWHYRLFCNENWVAIWPRKEVYSTEFTEKGWKSFTELYGREPKMVVGVD